LNGGGSIRAARRSRLTREFAGEKRTRARRDSIDRESDRDARDRCTVRHGIRSREEKWVTRDKRRRRTRMNWKNKLRRLKEDADNDDGNGEENDDDDDEDDDYDDYEGVLNGGFAEF